MLVPQGPHRETVNL